MPASPSPTDRRVLRDVAVGGAGGALLRAGVLAAVVTAGGAEIGAVVVLNLLGAALLARLVTLAAAEPRWLRRSPLLATGLLGAFTTYSGLVVPLAVLARSGDLPGAAGWGLGSLAGGVVLATVVLAAARR